MDVFDSPEVLALGLAGFLTAHGVRKKSLSPSGAVAAFLVGFFMIATKIGQLAKGRLEEGHAVAGYRDASQVLSNSLTALVATFTWAILFSPTSIHSKLIHAIYPSLVTGVDINYDPAAWCVVSPGIAHGLSRTLVFVLLGHFATCLGDTLASELGILSSSAPFLITTFKRVPPGTNGGLSLLGTVCSIVGGSVMGITMAISLASGNVACLPTNRPEIGGPFWTFILWGGLAGGLGSGIDSLLGATLQRTRYSTKAKLILQDHSKVAPTDEVKVISGWNVLTNNQVNLVSSAATALFLGWLA